MKIVLLLHQELPYITIYLLLFARVINQKLNMYCKFNEWPQGYFERRMKLAQNRNEFAFAPTQKQRQLISRSHLAGMVFSEKKNTAINNKRLYCISFEKMTHFPRVVKPKQDVNEQKPAVLCLVLQPPMVFTVSHPKDKGSQSSNTSPYLSTCIGQVYWWAHPLSMTTMQKWRNDFWTLEVKSWWHNRILVHALKISCAQNIS